MLLVYVYDSRFVKFFLRKSKWFIENNIKEPNLLDFLDIVSLGTICDVVPLVGLNRAIVKQGLKILNQKNLGLKTLIEICKIEKKASTYPSWLCTWS